MPLLHTPIARQMVTKAFRPNPFTPILKTLHFNKGHTVEIIKNMRKYFHKGGAKWGNSVKQTRFVYAKNYTHFLSAKHLKTSFRGN